jgi:uncharacterized membrane protein YhaH (DUF805 family)
MEKVDQTSADQAGTAAASYDVFLSYAREDLSTVKALVSEIEAEGLTVFWDRHIQLGQQWSDVLDQALREARVVIVVWSTASVKSTWVKAEATEAMALGRLVPLRIDNAAIPMPFGQVQTADVSPERPLCEQGVSIAAAIAALGSSANPQFRSAAGVSTAVSPANAAIPRSPDWRHAFLSMEGRLGRRDYWVCYLALTSLLALVSLLVQAIIGASAPGASMEVKANAAVFVYFITVYPQVALFIKRLHDFGWSGWWTLPAALLALLSAASTPYLDGSVSDERSAAWTLKVLLWAVVIFAGAMTSNPGVNKYGPPHRPR